MRDLMPPLFVASIFGLLAWRFAGWIEVAAIVLALTLALGLA